MRKILESCPSCGGHLEIREIECRECGTNVHAHFEPCPFCRLTVEQLQLLVLFVQARGNMRTLEQSLGLSYPTVRSRVEAIAERLRSGPTDMMGLTGGTADSTSAPTATADDPEGKTGKRDARANGQSRNHRATT